MHRITLAQGIEVAVTPLQNKRLIVVLAQQSDTLVALLNQMAGGAAGAGIVIEIKPGVGLRQAATAERQKRKAGGLQLRQPRIVIQSMGHD